VVRVLEQVLGLAQVAGRELVVEVVAVVRQQRIGASAVDRVGPALPLVQPLILASILMRTTPSACRSMAFAGMAGT